jgi:hypothetical protein
VAECRMEAIVENFLLSVPLSRNSNSPAWRPQECRFTASGIWMPALIASAPKMWTFAQTARNEKSAYGHPMRRILPAFPAGVSEAKRPTPHSGSASGNSRRALLSTKRGCGSGSLMLGRATGIGHRPEICSDPNSSKPCGLLTRNSNDRARRSNRCLC